MLESDMRGQLVKLLKPLGAFAVENGGAHPGTPDIALVPGWIECKATNNWPAREDTVVRLDHDLTNNQRIWLIKWSKAGGKAWVMLNIDGDWLLFLGGTAARHLGKSTKLQLFGLALETWKRKPTFEELEPLLEEN